MNHRTRLKRQAATMYRRHGKRYLSADRSNTLHRLIAWLHAVRAASGIAQVAFEQAATAGQHLLGQFRAIQLYSLPDQTNLSGGISEALLYSSIRRQIDHEQAYALHHSQTQQL